MSEQLKQQQHQARQLIAAQRLAAMQERTALLQKAFAAGESALPELLRTLQNGEIQRLGADRPRRVNVPALWPA